MFHVNTSIGRFWSDPVHPERNSISKERKSGLYRSLFWTAFLFTPVQILTVIISTAYVCSVCATCLHLCSSRSFFGKQKTALKHTMNIRSKPTLTDTAPEGRKQMCEVYKSWTSRERADKATFVYSTGGSYFYYYFWEVRQLRIRPNDSFCMYTHAIIRSFYWVSM